MLCDIWHGEKTTVFFLGFMKIINIIIPMIIVFQF